MRDVLLILKETFKDMWADLWTVLAINMAWSFANLLIVSGPPATLALNEYCNRIAHGEVADFSDFWRVFRRNWAPAWRWGGINLAVLLLLAADIYLTDRQSPETWVIYLQSLYITVMLVWLVIQNLALPFLFEQEKMKVGQALRNAVSLLGKNIGFVFLLEFFLLILFALGTLAFMLSLMFGAVFISCAHNRAVLNRLEPYRQTGGETGR